MKRVFETVFDRLREKSLDTNVLCAPFWRKVLKLKEEFDEGEAWELLLDNIEWMINMEVISTTELLNWFLSEELESHGIYFKGDVLVNNDRCIGIGKAHIKATGHSRVVLFDKASCDAYDTTFVSGYNHSFMRINDCVGNAFHSCKAQVRGYGKLESWSNSDVIAKNFSYVVLHDQAECNGTSHVHILKQ